MDFIAGMEFAKSNLEVANGNYKDAMFYYEAARLYSDSIDNEDLQKTIYYRKPGTSLKKSNRR